MKRLLVIVVAALTFGLADAVTSSGSLIVGRNPQHATLKLDATGHALVSFTADGKQQHVLVWGAINGMPPTRGRQQVAFKIDYSGGYGALKISNYWQKIKNVCKPYDGPPLAWYVPGSGCDAPDGSYWALQLWQRELPNLGFKPWKPDQAVWELHVSHWSGPLAQLQVWQDWAWGGRYHQILGQLTYAGKPVYGFGSSAVGAPTDSWGRNNYMDTFGSKYGAGWYRENSFLAQSPDGAFCYSFGPRPPYPGYPDSPPRQGNGSKYRITVIGPGVSPEIMWQGADVGDWNGSNADDQSIETKTGAVKQMLGLSQTECHS
jgi:hypothetical protein